MNRFIITLAAASILLVLILGIKQSIATTAEIEEPCPAKCEITIE